MLTKPLQRLPFEGIFPYRSCAELVICGTMGIELMN